MVEPEVIEFIVLVFFFVKSGPVLAIHIKNNELDIFPRILSDIILNDGDNGTCFSTSGIAIHSEMLPEENIRIVPNRNCTVIDISSYCRLPVLFLWCKDVTQHIVIQR